MAKKINFKEELKKFVKSYEEDNMKPNVYGFIGWLKSASENNDKETKELIEKLY